MNNRGQTYVDLLRHQKPSEVFRLILADAPPSQSRSRLYLIAKIRSTWNMPLEKVMPVGAWNVFEEDGVSDEEIDKAFSELKPNDQSI